MIRKQFYISSEQDHLLKRRARELGVSEAELVRRGLDFVLCDKVRALPTSVQLAALEAFLDGADTIVATSAPVRGDRWRREDAYDDERQARLMRLNPFLLGAGEIL